MTYINRRFSHERRVNADPRDHTLVYDHDFLKDSGSSISLATELGPDYTFTRASDSGDFGSDGFFGLAGGNDLPVYGHDPANANVQRGLLLQPARTNGILQSENLAATWTVTRCSDLQAQGTAPDGENTANRLTIDSSSEATHFIRQVGATLVDNTVYTASVFLKYVDLQWIRLRMINKSGSSANHYFDIQNGVKGSMTGTAIDGGIIDVGDGWLRCWTSSDSLTGASTHYMYVYLAQANLDPTWTGDGTSNMLMWGFDREAGAGPTSYIATTTGAVTRAKDICSTTNVDALNASNGMVFVQGLIPALDVQERSLVTIDDGGTTDVKRLYMDAAENINFETVNSGDTDGASDGAATIALDTVFKAAGIYEDDSVTGFVDGTASTEDTTAAIPVTDAATTLRIGDNSATTEFNGYIQKVKIYDVTKPATFGVSETA